MNIELRTVPAPQFAFPETIPVIPTAEYERRITALMAAAAALPTPADWVVVYADREHSANLTWLVNYDPRFEEALLVLGADGRRVLIVGNEGLGYLPIVRVPVETTLCQTFSLASQARDKAADLQQLLATIGLRAGQSIGVVGWKYLEAHESANPTAPAFVPAFVVDCLRAIGGTLFDATELLMHPQSGLRNQNGADQIAAFEWAARSTSAAVFRILRGTRPGMSEMQACSLMNYMGQPLSMHPILVSGKGPINGLRSPSNKVIEYGDAISTGLGYWGSLCCRAGLMRGEPDDAFFERIAAPYFRVIHAWYTNLRIGATGGSIHAAVMRSFAGSGLGPALNPGHLVSYEEWTSSPIRPDSNEQIRSGMMFQTDIIPAPLPDAALMNCEDTIVVADAALRSALRAAYPELWARVVERRRLMIEVLGIPLADEILPLTDATAYLPPFWLAPELVCVAAGNR